MHHDVADHLQMRLQLQHAINLLRHVNAMVKSDALNKIRDLLNLNPTLWALTLAKNIREIMKLLVDEV